MFETISDGLLASAIRAVLGGMAAALASGAPAAPACAAGEIGVAETCAPVDAAAGRIDAILRASAETHGLKAVLAGIATDGQPPTLLAWGESMTGVPATPDMHFRNGSIAIAYLGTVFLQLVDKGVLGPEDRLSRWFPDYPNADRVSLTMLINGTSGYADYVADGGFVAAFTANPFRQWRPDELIAIGLGRPMICEPGACWSYAHTNFVILGKVMETATGRPLDALIREGVLEPLAQTRSEATALIAPPVLHAFDGERGMYEESTYWNPSWTLAEGAIMTSTIADVLKSATAIGTGALVSPKSYALQKAPLTAKFKPWSETTYYGLGIFVVEGWIVQNPSFAGYAATMAYLPSRNLALAVSVTLGERALEGVLSTEVLKEIAAYLAPDAPLQ